MSVQLSTSAGAASGFLRRTDCPITWCRRTSCASRNCRERPAARSIAARSANSVPHDARPELAQEYTVARPRLQAWKKRSPASGATCWALDRVGVNDPFFEELGGNLSLLGRADADHQRPPGDAGLDVPLADVLPLPHHCRTGTAAISFDPRNRQADPAARPPRQFVGTGGLALAAGVHEGIAIVGMAGRFPGCEQCHTKLWPQLLCQGVEDGHLLHQRRTGFRGIHREVRQDAWSAYVKSAAASSTTSRTSTRRSSASVRAKRS